VLHRFDELYRLTPAHRARLRELAGLVERRPEPMPLVFEHGDAGPWNVLVTDDGRPALLDWEAAEPHGMPLWDLFYFVRSFGVAVARAEGTSSALVGFRRQFLGDRAVNRLLADAVTRHCGAIGLAHELVETLFVTCWAHRALKEASRLDAARLDTGHYVNLVRLCLDHPGAPGLRRLYGLRR
jgi:aminoglycoside phosphotransferase (APT) family kinase protein